MVNHCSCRLLCLFACAMAVFVAACDRGPAAPQQAGTQPSGAKAKVVIVATAAPVADLVNQIVGDWAEVSVLPASGSSAAATQPAEVTAAIGRADVIFVVGDGSDDGVQAYLRGSGARAGLDVIVFSELAHAGPRAASDGRIEPDRPSTTNPAEGSKGFAPPMSEMTFPVHPPGEEVSWPAPSLRRPWLDMMRTQRFLSALPARLQRYFPGLEPSLRNRVRMFRANLAMVQQEYDMRVTRTRGRRIAVVGEGLDTLPRALGVAVAAHPNVKDGGEASIAAAAEAIRESQAERLWIDAAMSEETVQALSRALGDGLRVVRLDMAVGELKLARSGYLAMMKANLESIADEAKREQGGGGQGRSGARSH